jgi:hypothetical protein
MIKIIRADRNTDQMIPVAGPCVPHRSMTRHPWISRDFVA